MALREVRGVLATTYRPVDTGYTVRNLPALSMQGKVTTSGLITVPISLGNEGQPADFYPTTLDMAGIPMDDSTKESNVQSPHPWIFYGLLLIVLLVVLKVV